MNPELLAYLLANCSADIHLHCGGRSVTSAGYAPGIAPVQAGHPLGPPVVRGFDELHGCPEPCPEIDYSNPNQPYFWDHTEMN